MACIILSIAYAKVRAGKPAGNKINSMPSGVNALRDESRLEILYIIQYNLIAAKMPITSDVISDSGINARLIMPVIPKNFQRDLLFLKASSRSSPELLYRYLFISDPKLYVKREGKYSTTAIAA